jgi:peptidoglycan/LPS O-acetylase OafA/YrhL
MMAMKHRVDALRDLSGVEVDVLTRTPHIQVQVEPVADRAKVEVSWLSSAVHIPALDGLRGLAILSVMWTHFANNGGMRAGSAADTFLLALLQYGRLGVDLFFVLSGFLITGILMDSKGGPHYFQNFYIRRVLRIFPLYYLFLLLWLVILPSVYTWPADAAIPVSPVWAWTYLINIIQSVHGDWRAAPPDASHLWSLAIEEQFYLLWPVVVFLCSRRALVLVSIALIVISILTRLALGLHGNYIATYFFTVARVDALAVGALLAVACRHPEARRRLTRAAPIVAGIALAVFLVLVWAPIRVSDGHDERLMLYTFSGSAVACLCGVLLLTAINGRPATERLFSHAALRFLGRYSYALYVFHFPIILLIARHFISINDIPIVAGSQVFALLLFAAIAGGTSVAVACLSWHLYEKQFLKLKDRFAYRPHGV